MCLLLAWVGLAPLLCGCNPDPGAVGTSNSEESGELDSLLDMVVIGGNARNPPFLFDCFEVTNSQFNQFMRQTGYVCPHLGSSAWDKDTGRLKEDKDWREYPVVQVTLSDAQAYARWKGKRLPTFQEWVRASRLRYRDEYPWGTRSPEKYYTNTISTRLFSTAPVGSFPNGQSLYGAQDMVGNVWEWTGTVPEFWSEDLPLLRKSVHVFPWFHRILPSFDRTLRQDRMEMNQGNPIWFPNLLPGFLTSPDRLEKAVPTIPVPYMGQGRLVVGGSFRSREISNFPIAAVEGAVIYKELEWGTVSVQLVEPEEWRDDIGFRCARDVTSRDISIMIRALISANPKKQAQILDMLVRIGPDLVRSHVNPLLEALVKGNQEKRDLIERILERLGKDLVGPHLVDFSSGMDRDLEKRINRLRESFK